MRLNAYTCSFQLYALLLGMGWLASIEFDLHVSLPGDEKDGEQDEEYNEDTAEALEVRQVIVSIKDMNRTFGTYPLVYLVRWKGKKSGSSC